MRKTPASTAELVCRLYGEGKPVGVIEKEARVSMTTVYQILRDCGITMQGQARIVREEGPPLTERQMEIINGSLLGDGCICRSKKRGNDWFAKGQAPFRREYLEWHYEALKPYSSRITESTRNRPVCIKGQVSSHPTEKTSGLYFCTGNSVWFTRLREKWYPAGVKAVPRDLELTPLLLAVWFCDDGNNYVGGRRATFATDCFSRDDCEFLGSLLERLSLQWYLKDTHKETKRGTRRYEVVISSPVYLDFIELIRPHVVWGCFRYKVGLDGYTAPGPLYNARLTPDEIREVHRLWSEGWTRKQLEARFHASPHVIQGIIRGESFKELAPEGAKLGPIKPTLYAYNGEHRIASEWARLFGLPVLTTRFRLRHGIPLNIPLQKSKKRLPRIVAK